MSELVPLTGLWLNEKNGNKYFSGYLGNAKILIFRNKHKTEDKHPDYQMYIASREHHQDGGFQGNEPQASTHQNAPEQPRAEAVKKVFEDDIQF